MELEWHLFALIFLLSAAYTLKEDKHVRVDLFYDRFSARDKAWVNIIGTIFLLVPWCLVLLWVSFDYAYGSWMIREGSPDPGGLPARYVIKFGIGLAFVLLLIQALMLAAKSYWTLKNRDR